MTHALTIQLPHSLLQKLDAAAKQRGVSKGALVREALEAFLKVRRSKVNWDEIYAQTRVETGMTVEEEIARSRRRP